MGPCSVVLVEGRKLRFSLPSDASANINVIKCVHFTSFVPGLPFFTFPANNCRRLHLKDEMSVENTKFLSFPFIDLTFGFTISQQSLSPFIFKQIFLSLAIPLIV